MHELIAKLQPDAVCILQDPWILVHFLNQRPDIPIAAYIPVDAKNQDPRVCTALNGLDLAIFYTGFGEQECRIPGFKGMSAVIPHGVDLTLYHPVDRLEARRKLDVPGLPLDAFVFGNVNRNSPRKRLDLTIQYFAEWLRQRAGAADRIKDAYLYIHCSPRDTAGLDLAEMASYYGIAKKFIMPPEDLITPAVGVPEDQMLYVYGSLDVQISTAAGEGFGLPQIEAAACGIPQIVPQFSGLGEWMAGAAYMVPCSATMAHPNINTIGAIPDKAEFIRAMDLMYRNPAIRERYAGLALARARDPRFDWQAIGAQFDSELHQMLKLYRIESAKLAVAEKQKADKASKEPKQNAEIPETEYLSATA
jgi:D-inositol-3-phosphate glycosyltransferase